jgi:hypothetical protein
MFDPHVTLAGQDVPALGPPALRDVRRPDVGPVGAVGVQDEPLDEEGRASVRNRDDVDEHATVRCAALRGESVVVGGVGDADHERA